MRTLSLVSQKGGAGKTTLSIHLAVAAHMAGLSVAIVDLDPQASAWKWSKRRDAEPYAATATAEQLEDVQARARAGGLDLLIVDSAPHADRPAIIACRAADFVLVPCKPSIMDVDAIAATLDITAFAKRPCAVVLNDCNTTTDADLAGTRGGLTDRGVPLYGGALYHRVGFSRPLSGGLCAQESEPGGRAAQEIDALFAWTMGELGLELPRAAA
jgi:chromosome partitioning protein